MSECKHVNRVTVYGKCSDLASVTYHDGTETDGYMPSPSFGLGSGDDIFFTVCIDCGKATSFNREKYDEALHRVKLGIQ